MRTIRISKWFFRKKPFSYQERVFEKMVLQNSSWLELAAPVGRSGRRKAGFELCFIINCENKCLRSVGTALAFSGVGSAAPVSTIGA